MLKFTEKIGDIELSFEGESVEEVVKLKNALSPSMISVKNHCCEEFEKLLLADPGHLAKISCCNCI